MCLSHRYCLNSPLISRDQLALLSHSKHFIAQLLNFFGGTLQHPIYKQLRERDRDRTPTWTGDSNLLGYSSNSH